MIENIQNTLSSYHTLPSKKTPTQIWAGVLPIDQLVLIIQQKSNYFFFLFVFVVFLVVLFVFFAAMDESPPLFSMIILSCIEAKKMSSISVCFKKDDLGWNSNKN